MKRLAILTSGGDCSGMNAVIRAAARTAIANDVEMIGYRKGYAGLMKTILSSWTPGRFPVCCNGAALFCSRPAPLNSVLKKDVKKLWTT